MVTRRYTESEVRQIFDRAVEAGTVESPVASDGLSIEQIKEIGAEVGIEGHSLELAAHSLETRSPERLSRLAGGLVAVHAECRVTGELDACP
jgi:phosphate uptake regulator